MKDGKRQMPVTTKEFVVHGCESFLTAIYQSIKSVYFPQRRAHNGTLLSVVYGQPAEQNIGRNKE
jgi:hypothetical protein